MLDQDAIAAGVPSPRVDGARASLLTIGAPLCGAAVGSLSGVSRDVGLTASSIAAAVACWCAVCVALAAGSDRRSAGWAANRSLAFVTSAATVVVVPASSVLAGWPMERSLSIALPLGVVFVLAARRSPASVPVAAPWVAAMCGVAAALCAVLGTSGRTIDSDVAVVIGVMAVAAIATIVLLVLVLVAPATRGPWLILGFIAAIAAVAAPIVPTIAAFAAAAWCAHALDQAPAIATPERPTPATRASSSRVEATEHARIGVRPARAAKQERLLRISASTPETEQVGSPDPERAVVGDLREQLRRARGTGGRVPPARARTRSSAAFGSGATDPEQRAFLDRLGQALDDVKSSRSSTPEHHHDPRGGHDHHQ